MYALSGVMFRQWRWLRLVQPKRCRLLQMRCRLFMVSLCLWICVGRRRGVCVCSSSIPSLWVIRSCTGGVCGHASQKRRSRPGGIVSFFFWKALLPAQVLDAVSHNSALILCCAVGPYEFAGEATPPNGHEAQNHIQRRSYDALVWAPNAESLETHYKTIIDHLENKANSPLKKLRAHRKSLGS